MGGNAMTITLTREEAQQVLEHLDDLLDFQQWDIDMHVTQYGEGYKPHRVKHMKQQLASTNSTIEALRNKLIAPDVMINGLTEQETAETMSVKGLAQPESEQLGEIMPADEEQLKRIAKLVGSEPEPVAWLYRGDGMVQVLIKRNDHFFSLDEGENFIKGDPLYTAPPQREWQGLTDEEANELCFASVEEIEAKLKEKNASHL
jgi:hypothetical protein